MGKAKGQKTKKVTKSSLMGTTSRSGETQVSHSTGLSGALLEDKTLHLLVWLHRKILHPRCSIKSLGHFLHQPEFQYTKCLLKCLAVPQILKHPQMTPVVSEKTTRPRKKTPLLLVALILILKLAMERLPRLGLICSRTAESLPRDLA